MLSIFVLLCVAAFSVQQAARLSLALTAAIIIVYRLIVEVVDIVYIVVVAVAWWRVDQHAEWRTVSGRLRGIN